MMLWHFIVTRWFSPPCPRERLLAKQQKKLSRFLRRAVEHSPFYKHLPPDLAALPVMQKADFLANFAALNAHGITLAEATDVALRAEQERYFKPTLRGTDLTVGLSSGTSGARHVFLVSRNERCRWAGQMLARMLSANSLRRVINPFAPPLQIAFFLRASSNLYTTLNSARVKLVYYDLTRPFKHLCDELNQQRPDVLVAPATVLAALAREDRTKANSLRPTQIISVAEVLDQRDRASIEQAFGVSVSQVYQATEGFLGYTCECGRLHLNEDTLHIEPQWMDEKHDRFQPLITDFTRSSQWFIRYHLNDILRAHDDACPCGRSTLTLRSIEGRAEEVLWARDAEGKLSPIFPDALRQAFYSLPNTLDLYRVEQHGERWEIRLRHSEARAPIEQSVLDSIHQLLAKLGLTPPTIHFLPWTEQAPAEKQKRIRCITRPE